MPTAGESGLAQLSRHSIDVAGLQRTCEDRYKEWHSARLGSVLDWLSRLEPVPNVVLFPEGSVSLDLLQPLFDFAHAFEAVVVAGTHTFRLTHEAGKVYKKLGINPKTHGEWGAHHDETLSVLPLFTPDRSHFHLKSFPSVFERTDVHHPGNKKPTIDCVSATTRGHKLTILPLVCAEALCDHDVRGTPDLVVIPSYNDGIDPFRPLIERYVRNQVPVVFCNDGRFGGSSIHVALDRRMDTWWWGDPIGGLLPPSDGVLIADIDMSSLAPQVGVANPQQSVHLAVVAAIVGKQGNPSHLAVSEQLQRIREAGSNDAQAEMLSQCLDHEQPSPIQALKLMQLRRLAENGNATGQWWDALGSDCVLDDLTDLSGLEGRLGGACSSRVASILDSTDIDDDQAVGKLVKFKRRCDALANAGETPSMPAGSPQAYSPSVIDRDKDIRSLKTFLDHPKQAVLCVSGLNAIGKTTVIESALAQSGTSKVINISMTGDSTPDFLVASLCRELGVPFKDAITSRNALQGDDVVDRLPRRQVVILGDADYLLEHGSWRDPAAAEVLGELTKALRHRSGKLIVESVQRFPIEDKVNPAVIRRLRLSGLPDDHGVDLLDQHLRRLDLEPTNYDRQDRLRIVQYLGGHPGALIFATEFIDKAGMREVLEDLRRRRGIHARIVRHILREMNFTDEQQSILSSISLVRIPIRSQVLNKVVDFNAVAVAHDLWRMGILDRAANDFVSISPLLRGFADLASPPPATVASVHKDPRNAFVLLRWGATLVEIARELTAEREPEAARYCVEQAKDVAGKVLEFDTDNPSALTLLEQLSDEFNVQ